jgi:hypothetical protein
LWIEDGRAYQARSGAFVSDHHRPARQKLAPAPYCGVASRKTSLDGLEDEPGLPRKNTPWKKILNLSISGLSFVEVVELGFISDGDGPGA